MSSFTISPELRGVLEDVVKQPRQRLFVGTFFHDLQRAFARDAQPVGVAAPGLSSAERHLLQMHRQELSRCLLQGFLAHFFAPDGPSGLFYLDGEQPTEPERHELIRHTRDSAPAEAFERRTGYWLHHLLEGTPLRDFRTLGGLLAGALRLQESERAELYMGILENRFNRRSSALLRLDRLTQSARLDVRLSAMRSCQAASWKLGDVQAFNHWTFVELQMTRELEPQSAIDSVARLSSSIAVRPLPITRQVSDAATAMVGTEFSRLQSLHAEFVASMTSTKPGRRHLRRTPMDPLDLLDQS